MKKPAIVWLNASIFALTGLIALIGVPYYAFAVGFDQFTIIATIITLGFCGLSITAGYHRLWAHKTYQAHPVLAFAFAIGGAFALQNSALHWSSDHRVHHKHVDDNDKDPYSAKMGFWHSHIGWMLREYQASFYSNYNNVRDLQRNKIVAWQHKYYVPLALLTNFGIPIALGLYHGEMIGMLLSVGVLRLVLNHHTTFFINSLAHIWGKRPYTDKNTARDNGILAFFTYGEGYHNFHHIFEHDYRNGIKWWHYDPTKWLIKLFSYIKLTSKLRISPEDRIEKARADMLLKVSTEKLQKLSKLSNYQEQLERLQLEHEKLMVKLNEYYDTRRQLLELKKQKMLDQYEHSQLKERYQSFKVNWDLQKKQWLKFNQQLVLTAQSA
ncbi:MAG: stearoyl-CoA desaturase (delta-9 desaturase) [Alteromonadaceae bacterium]|jgi:stearoyl-CoA desaturase (delta-9 desaturase)